MGNSRFGLFSALYSAEPGYSVLIGTYTVDLFDAGATPDDRIGSTEVDTDLLFEPLGLESSLAGTTAEASLHADAAFITDFWQDGGLTASERERLFNLAIRSDIGITYDVHN